MSERIKIERSTLELENNLMMEWKNFDYLIRVTSISVERLFKISQMFKRGDSKLITGKNQLFRLLQAVKK